MQEISVITTKFKDKTKDIVEIIQGQMTWLEINKEPPENTPVKNPERLQLEYELIGFSNKAAEKLINVVKRTTNRCT